MDTLEKTWPRLRVLKVPVWKTEGMETFSLFNVLGLFSASASYLYQIEMGRIRPCRMVACSRR